jgi:hypothetical protein
LRSIAYQSNNKEINQFSTNKNLFEKFIVQQISTKFAGQLVGDNAYRLGTVPKGASIFYGDDKVPLYQDVTDTKAL